jgi:hypothetical protein
MENQRSNTPSDEIDIGSVLSKIGDGIQSAWLGLMRFLALVRRVPFENKISFIFIIVTSIAIGVLFSFYLRKNYYESTMILSSDYLNKRLAESTVDKLAQLAGEPKKNGLTKALNLKDTLADNIIGFEVKPFIEEKDIVEIEVLKEQLRSAQATSANKEVINQVIRQIEIENRHAFEITVRTLNPAVIPNLQEAIVNYFRTNPYIKKRIEINRQILVREQVKLSSDIRKLDSLKKIMYANYRSMAEQTRQGSNNVILSDKAVTNPIDIYKQDQELYADLQDVERKLYIQPDFEIVEGFTEFSEPAGASVAKMLFYSLIIGIAIAYIDVALRGFNRYLANLK